MKRMRVVSTKEKPKNFMMTFKSTWEFTGNFLLITSDVSLSLSMLYLNGITHMESIKIWFGTDEYNYILREQRQ